jgi:hypothetical protein
VQFHAKEAFVEDHLMWCRIKCQGKPSWAILFLPKPLVPEVMWGIHWHELAHPRGALQAPERALQDYYWISINANISNHLQVCRQCQPTAPNTKLCFELNSNLDCTTEINQRIPLSVPLIATDRGKWFIPCITDPYFWYAQLAWKQWSPLPTLCLTIGSVSSELPSKSPWSRKKIFDMKHSKDWKPESPELRSRCFLPMI